MKKIFLICGLFSALGVLAAGCGGNVVVTGGSGANSNSNGNGAGGTNAGGNGGKGGNGGIGGGPQVDACQAYVNNVIAKYTECGINVMVGSGMVNCTPALAAQ